MNIHDNITIKEYIDLKVETLEKNVTLSSHALDLRLESINAATNIASVALEKRLEGMNEFRNQLKDQALTFMTRSENHILMNKIDDSINLLRDQVAATATKKDHEKNAEDIRVLRESKAMLEGKASQTAVNISILIAVIGILLSLVNLASKFSITSTTPTIAVPMTLPSSTVSSH